MFSNTRNVWLLVVPLAALISLFLVKPPASLNINTYENLPARTDSNTFYPIEEIFSELYRADKSGFEIDTQTEKALSKITGRADVRFDQSLFEKTFPAVKGKYWEQLVKCYKAYKDVEQQITERYVLQSDNYILDFRALQKEFFGEVALPLFADYHQLYGSADVAGIQLIVPTFEGVTALVCTEIKTLD